MRDHRWLRGFRAGAIGGVLVGLLIGSAGMAVAAFGYQGWQRFSNDFKVGYVTGFLAMANLARNLQPGGWVDIKYPAIPKARPVEWADVVNDLYKDPANQGYSIASILQSTAYHLEKKYGKAISSDERTRQRMEHQLEALRRKRLAAGEKAGESKAIPAPPKVVSGPVLGGTPPAAKSPASKPARKWCRCDGKDPKVERAARKAARAAGKAAETGKAGGNASSNSSAIQGSTAPAATKTPPAADKPAAK